MNKERKDWCYIHNEEKDCYNEDADHDDYHCRKCEHPTAYHGHVSEKKKFQKVVHISNLKN